MRGKWRKCSFNGKGHCETTIRVMLDGDIFLYQDFTQHRKDLSWSNDFTLVSLFAKYSAPDVCVWSLGQPFLFCSLWPCQFRLKQWHHTKMAWRQLRSRQNEPDCWFRLPIFPNVTHRGYGRFWHLTGQSIAEYREMLASGVARTLGVVAYSTFLLSFYSVAAHYARRLSMAIQSSVPYPTFEFTDIKHAQVVGLLVVCSSADDTWFQPLTNVLIANDMKREGALNRTNEISYAT